MGGGLHGRLHPSHYGLLYYTKGKPKTFRRIRTPSKGARHFGMGRYVRAEHETCIVAARGRGSRVVRLHNVRSTFEASVGRHSEKPESFYGIVEAWLEGPYVELFARRRRKGWACHGNEVEAD